MQFTKHKLPAAEFPLAPMIDIVFLLLAFFIVTYQMTDNEKSLDINLPTSEEGKPRKRASHLEAVINVSEDGKIVIKKKEYTFETLTAHMATLARVNKSQPIRIRGDAKTPYEYIVKTIDSCRKGGIWNISFATKKPSAK